MPASRLPKLVAVVGPTASGKTELGLLIAQKYTGEIISADSKQVYRGMDIGTAKEKDLPVKQHLLDIIDPGQRMTVAEYQRLAYQAIEALLTRGKLPVLVGGSGLYAEAVLKGYQFEKKEKSKRAQPRYQSLKIGIEWERSALLARVVDRTENWLEHGLLEEIQALLKQGVAVDWLLHCGQEYRYFTQFLLGEISQEQAIEKTNTSINQFIKRQYTWWRRHPDLQWVKGEVEALELVRAFLGPLN